MKPLYAKRKAVYKAEDIEAYFQCQCKALSTMGGWIGLARKIHLRRTVYVCRALYVRHSTVYSFANVFRYSDPDGSLPLSALQRAKFGGWKRPSEIMRNPKMIELVSRYITSHRFIQGLQADIWYTNTRFLVPHLCKMLWQTVRLSHHFVSQLRTRESSGSR